MDTMQAYILFEASRSLVFVEKVWRRADRKREGYTFAAISTSHLLEFRSSSTHE
jgi:hypothetical protein